MCFCFFFAFGLSGLLRALALYFQLPNLPLCFRYYLRSSVLPWRFEVKFLLRYPVPRKFCRRNKFLLSVVVRIFQFQKYINKSFSLFQVRFAIFHCSQNFILLGKGTLNGRFAGLYLKLFVDSITDLRNCLISLT